MVRLTLFLYHLDDSGEGLGMVHREVGQHFAVKLDAVLVELTHEDGVRDAVHAATGVDSVDPQRAELALLVLTVAVGVGLTFFPLVLGNGPNVFTSAPITFGAVEDFLSACSGSNCID